VTADTPRGLQAYQPGPNTFTTPGKPLTATDRAASATPAVKSDLNLELRRNIYDDKGKEIKASDNAQKQANGDSATANGLSSNEVALKTMKEAAEEPKQTVNCSSCGIDCTRCRFHYAKNDNISATSTQTDVKYDLCPNCYFQARMPSTHRSSDFVKLEEPAYKSIPDRDAPWSDSETLLLLEGLEAFDENWTKVADHVKTRTREECVVRFLQLEIQDKFIEDEPAYNNATSVALNGRMPINQVENPVMSTVSFLAQLANPAVVAAATGRSVEVLKKELRDQLEKGMGGPVQEPEPEAVKTEDSMDIDAEALASDPTANGDSNPVNDLAAIGLAAAGARSGALYSHEERDMIRVVGGAVNVMLEKFESKQAQFSEMEELVQAERRDLEKARQQLLLDRLAFRKRMKDMEDAFRAATLKGPEEGMRMMQEAVGMTSGKKFGFQSTNGASNGVGTVAGEGGDGRASEL
jgi:SWI/SNF related-matrix-associated actin-dependent regulator of chromatin subfamily C